MANNRELLKEALADAKSLREMAITNAKAALEESFAPQIKSMFSSKLQEMEELEEEDDIYEADEEEDDMQNEELNLDEILAELEETEETDVPPLNEDDEEDDESEESEDEEGEGEDGDDEEPIDVEDMSTEDLKDFVESIIADMMETGEFEPEEEGEGDELEGEEGDLEGVEDDMVDIDELLAEIDEEGTSDLNGEDLEENWIGDAIKSVGSAMNQALSVNPLGKSFLKDNAQEFKSIKANSTPEKIDAFMNKFQAEMEDQYATSKIFSSDRSAIRSLFTGEESGGRTSHVAENEDMQLELEEAYGAIKTLKSELNEVNLLNAKLLYTNRIFKSKNLTESQKVKVLSTFDKASNVSEVELVYETLNGTFNTKKKPMNENMGRASKSIGSTKSKKPIIENAAYTRMQELAFYNAKH